MTKQDHWTHQLVMAGSEIRAPVLAQALRATRGKKAKRQLLADWFNVCEALAPAREELRVQMELAGFFTDHDGAPPELPVTVYRAAWEDDEAELALSWTTDLAVAERFCKGLVSLRAMFLGIYRDDVDAYVWRATCTEMYGYLTGRDEHEVIAKTLEDVEPIASLITERRGDASALMQALRGDTGDG